MFIDNEYNIVRIFRGLSIAIFIFGILIPVFLWARCHSIGKYKKAEKYKIIFLIMWSLILTFYFIIVYWSKGVYEIWKDWSIWIIIPVIVYANTISSIYKYCINRKRGKADEEKSKRK